MPDYQGSLSERMGALTSDHGQQIGVATFTEPGKLPCTLTGLTWNLLNRGTSEQQSLDRLCAHAIQDFRMRAQALPEVLASIEKAPLPTSSVIRALQEEYAQSVQKAFYSNNPVNCEETEEAYRDRKHKQLHELIRKIDTTKPGLDFIQLQEADILTSPEHWLSKTEQGKDAFKRMRADFCNALMARGWQVLQSEGRARSIVTLINTRTLDPLTDMPGEGFCLGVHGKHQGFEKLCAHRSSGQKVSLACLHLDFDVDDFQDLLDRQYQRREEGIGCFWMGDTNHPVATLPGARADAKIATHFTFDKATGAFSIMDEIVRPEGDKEQVPKSYDSAFICASKAGKAQYVEGHKECFFLKKGANKVACFLDFRPLQFVCDSKMLVLTGGPWSEDEKVHVEAILAKQDVNAMPVPQVAEYSRPKRAAPLPEKPSRIGVPFYRQLSFWGAILLAPLTLGMSFLLWWAFQTKVRSCPQQAVLFKGERLVSYTSPHPQHFSPAYGLAQCRQCLSPGSSLLSHRMTARLQ